MQESDRGTGGCFEHSSCICRFCLHPNTSCWCSGRYTSSSVSAQDGTREDKNNDWGVSDENSAADTQAARFSPCTVTYWATIESGGKEIYVPIDSENVSGPEKSIATGGMQKVWKWIHDKGLDDKFGLQDAFNLAQSMHKEDIEDCRSVNLDPRMSQGCQIAQGLPDLIGALLSRAY